MGATLVVAGVMPAVIKDEKWRVNASFRTDLGNSLALSQCQTYLY